MAALLAKIYLRPDDASFVIGPYRAIKQSIAYILTAVSVVLLDEYYIKQKFGFKKDVEDKLSSKAEIF
jgi:hypothetical protein